MRGIGPNFMPGLVAAGLIVLRRAGCCDEALTGGCREHRPEHERDARTEPAFAWVSAGLFAHMALIDRRRLRHRLHACSSPCVARGFGSRRAASRDLGIALVVAAAICAVLRRLLNVNLPAGCSRRCSAARDLTMDTLDAADARFRRRARADEPAVGLHRRARSARRSACCPASGPALTVAMLLPITAKLDPTGALIMFAGIYYGAMYGGSTTSILLNTPGEIGLHRRPRWRATRWPSAGAPARRSPPRAIGSFVAGTHRDRRCSRCSRRWWSSSALQVRPARVLRADGARVHHRVGRARRARRVRGLTSLFLGLLLGLVGIDSQTGQARFTFGVPELLDGIDVVVRRGRPVRGRRNAVRRRATRAGRRNAWSRSRARSG